MGFLLLVPEDVTNCRQVSHLNNELPAFSITVFAATVADISNFRLKDMKILDFTKFTNLIEEQEPVFREALAAANCMMKGGFLDQVSYPETAVAYLQNSLLSLPSGLNISGETTSTLSAHENGLWIGDVSSGLDLDTLLAYYFQQANRDQQPTNILDQCYLWQST